MDGEYLRVTPDELARVIQDPDWGRDLLESIQDAEGRAAPPPALARFLTTHKAWQAIGFLLERAGFPVDVVYGEERLADDVDWGYGPPGYLTAGRVRLAAEAFGSTSYDHLIGPVTRADLARAAVYPDCWDEDDSLEWVRAWYEPLVAYFAAAAGQGDAMLIWIA